jgi:hypothetical protein
MVYGSWYQFRVKGERAFERNHTKMRVLKMSAKNKLALIVAIMVMVFGLNSNVFAIGEGLGPMAPQLDNPMMPGSSSNSNNGGTLERRTRDGAKTLDELVAEANTDIAGLITKLAETLNSGKEVPAELTSSIANAVRSYTKYSTKMKSTEQANYQILSAWSKYFAGQLKPARAAAMAAFKADPKSRNARTTLVAMALVNDDVRSLKSATGMVKQTKARRTSGADAAFNTPEATQESAPPSDASTIEFDAESMMMDVMGQKIGAVEARCINGSSFSFQGGKTLFAIAWSLENTGNKAAASTSGDQQAAPGGMGMMPGMSTPTTDSSGKLNAMQSFAQVFESNFDSENLAFVGINLDDPSESKQVVATLLRNGWPWSQVMAKDPANDTMAKLAKVNAKAPVLVIVASDGTVIYAGSASGVVARMVAQHAAGTAQKGTLTATAAETNSAAAESSSAANATAETGKSSTDAGQVSETGKSATSGQANANANANTNAAASTQASADQNSAEPVVKKQMSEEEQLNPAASNLYQFALSQKKMAKFTGYGKMVEACRQVMREYPASKEAEGCRQLLREIPANKRAQFHITNEEMGL